MKRLNLGCGKVILEGYINLDLFNIEGIDVIHNLNEYPYPFEDNYFDEILADNIMEHLDSPIKFCEEIWRISNNGAKIKIITPHFSSGCASWADLTHRRPFSVYSFDNYYPIEELDKSKTTLEIFRPMRFRYKCHLTFGKMHRIIGIELLANIWQKGYENFWCYLFPARSVTFNLEVVKKLLK